MKKADFQILDGPVRDTISTRGQLIVSCGTGRSRSGVYELLKKCPLPSWPPDPLAWPSAGLWSDSRVVTAVSYVAHRHTLPGLYQRGPLRPPELCETRG